MYNNKKMYNRLEKLDIGELYHYLKLCEMNMEYLGMKRKLHDNSIDEDFNYTRSLRIKLYNEVNKRLEELTKEEDV